MAKKYDYSNVEFAKRIKLRKDIMTLNRVISGIVYSIGYPANVFIYISEKYYNQTRGEIVEGYPEGANPIDYLNSKALYAYREYLNDIILHWESRKLTLNEFKPTDFSVSIEECAKIARQRAKKQNAMPHNNTASKLPANITGAMIKKVDYTLKQANFKDGEFNRTIVDSRQKSRKKPSVKKVVIDKDQLKGAVKEAIVDLAMENKQKLEKEKLSKKETTKKQDINLFNYEEFYSKEKQTNKSKTEEPEIDYEKVKSLEEEIDRTERFLKAIVFSMDNAASEQMRLKAQDYFATHYKDKEKQLNEMKEQLQEMLEKQPKVKER